MAKKVRLTWVNGPFAIIEICNRLEEEDINQLYYVVGEMIVAPVDEIIKAGMVLFEDNEGIFSLYAAQIVSIEDV